MRTTLDMALIRWSVKCVAWSNGHSVSGPQLGAFLAGWFCRDGGIESTDIADTIQFRDSFRAGWGECDDHLAIYEQVDAPTKD